MHRRNNPEAIRHKVEEITFIRSMPASLRHGIASGTIWIDEGFDMLNKACSDALRDNNIRANPRQLSRVEH